VRRVVESRDMVSFVVSTVLGLYLFRALPFPVENNLLQMVLLTKPHSSTELSTPLLPCLFTTPTSHSRFCSHLHTSLRCGRKEQVEARRLAPYVPPASRNDLDLVIGELHHPQARPAGGTPQWLIVPERGLFTGIAIFGAVGSGKSSGCMYPFAEQVLAYQAEKGL